MIMQKADWKKNEFTDEFADEHAFANVPRLKSFWRVFFVSNLVLFQPQCLRK